jgi:hypothetical protein
MTTVFNEYSLKQRDLVDKASSYVLQIKSISRAPDDKAIAAAECDSELSCFAIVDLKQGKVVDDLGASFIITSPDRRFIFYKNGCSRTSKPTRTNITSTTR